MGAIALLSVSGGFRLIISLALLWIGWALAVPASAAALQPVTAASWPAASHYQPVAHRTCGLRLDGVGPDARCSRYRDACVRDGNPLARCEERLDACVRCAVAYQDCEKRATGIARFLTSCEACIARFKACTREYDKRLPARWH